MTTSKDEKAKIRKRAQQIAEFLGYNYTELLIELQAQFIEDKTDEVFAKLQSGEKGGTNGRK